MPASATGSDRYIAPLLLGAAVFLLVYGVELFDFGLSIDEEAATYVTDTVRIALAQGRWGISLTLLCLPNIGPIPIVSTLMFGAGLLYATWRAFHDFSLGRTQAFVFAAVHVAFPMWLHIVQFSTIAGIVGLGLAAAAAGGHLALHGSVRMKLVAALLIAYAVSVYQTLGVYCAMYVLLALHADAIARGHRLLGRETARAFAAAAATLLGGLVLYSVIQKVSLAASGTETAYIDGFVQVGRLATEPGPALRDVVDYVVQLLAGRHPAYVGWGPAILFLSWLGLVPLGLMRRSAERRGELRRWLGMLLVALAGVVLVALPTIVTVATLPLRGYVALPLFAAWLASRVPSQFGTPLGTLHAVAVAYFVVVAAAISSRLFYSDQVVHNADAALTQQLMSAMDRVAAENGIKGPIPFSLVGSRSFSFAGELVRIEQFGASFYEQDEGNVYRVAYYMQLQGHPPLQPIWLGHRPELVPAAKAMPIWPEEGSVQVVNGVVLVKLGPPTNAQFKSN